MKVPAPLASLPITGGSMLSPAFRIGLVLIFAAPASPAALALDAAAAQHLETLRQRGDFKEAEERCLESLAKADPQERSSAELTVELIRTYAAWASNAAPADRPALWKRARDAAADFLRQHPRHPGAILVRVAQALTPLATGECARFELENDSVAAERRAEALRDLRESTGLLEKLDAELTVEIPLRRRAPPPRGELTGDELFALHRQVVHSLGRAQKSRALLFPEGNQDRLALLLAAEETLARPLAQFPAGDSLAADIQLDLAECHRLLGQLDEAENLAQAVDRGSAPVASRLKGRAELIRIALARQSHQAVSRLLESARETAGEPSPELDLACLEANLFLAHAVGRGSYRPPAEKEPDPRKLAPEELAKRFESDAAALAARLDERHGAFWARRAKGRLAAALGGERADEAGIRNAALLSRAAEALYLQGKLDDAAATYDKAAQAASIDRDLPSSFELAYKAALVEQASGKHAQAATRLRILAKSMATHPRAAEAHLLAAWNAGQLAAAGENAANHYAALLREHLAVFSSAKTVDQARTWLGQFHEARRAWAAAIAAYQEIAPESEQFEAAMLPLAHCWQVRLAELAGEGKPTAQAAAEATDYFLKSGAASRDAALAAAQLAVAWRADRAASAEQLLSEHLAAPQNPGTWKEAARDQLVATIAIQPGRSEDALAALQAVEGATPERLFRILEALSEIAMAGDGRSLTQDHAAEVGNVQMAVVALLKPQKTLLPKSAQGEFERLSAAAMLRAGRRDEAIAAFAALAKSHADDRQIQEQYAELLLASESAQHWPAALAQWRLVAQRTRPRTPAWYRAKYSVALAQFKLNDRAGAAALLRFLLKTPPGMKGNEWEGKYLELLSRCEN